MQSFGCFVFFNDGDFIASLACLLLASFADTITESLASTSLSTRIESMEDKCNSNFSYCRWRINAANSTDLVNYITIPGTGKVGHTRRYNTLHLLVVFSVSSYPLLVETIVQMADDNVMKSRTHARCDIVIRLATRFLPLK